MGEPLDQELESAACSVLSSSVMPVTHPSSSSSSHTLSWDSPCPRLWVSSVLWWLSSSCSPSKQLTHFKPCELNVVYVGGPCTIKCTKWDDFKFMATYLLPSRHGIAVN